MAYQRGHGFDDGCNVLQYSWLTTHSLARERVRLYHAWY